MISYMNKKRIKFTQGMENKYIKQLFLGCNDKNCGNAFCRVNDTHSVVITAAEKLQIYDDLFLCKNTIKMLGFKSKKHTSTEVKQKETPSIDFSNAKNGDNLVIEFVLNVLSLTNKLDNIENLSNTYCELIKKEHDGINLFFMKNIFIILLKKYEENPWSTLGLIIIRIFVTFNNFSFLTTINLSRLVNVLVNIHAKFLGDYSENLIYSSQIGKEELKTDVYTIRDYIHIVHAVKCVLENQKEHCIRRNQHIEDLLELFTTLFYFNEQKDIFPYNKFYLPNFCNKYEIKDEFKLYRSGCKNIIKYNFILPLDSKAEYYKYEHTDSMKDSLQDAFFRALFEGSKEPYLFLTVSRLTIYPETFDFLNNVTHMDLRKQLKIKFKNEEGVDSGGIKKEFFQLLSEEIQDDTSLFECRNNCLWIKHRKEKNNMHKFLALGKLIGIALYNDMILNLPFPRFFFKKLLDKKIEFDDLSEIEPEIYISLSNLKKCSEEEYDKLELTFVVPYNGIDIHLKGNSEEKITASNIDEFILLFSDYILNKSISQEILLIKKGFNYIINKKSLFFLQAEELEKIIVGSTCIDVEQIKNHSITNGFDENDETVFHFWEIFKEYGSEEKKRLLQFITGNDRMPVSGASDLKMVIMENGCDTERLPSAQTCFNTLLLPKYKDKEKLRIKLEKAITMTKGFYLL